MPGPATKAEPKMQMAATAVRHTVVSTRNQLDSPFLRLPSEIRNQIYYFALGDHEIYLMPSGNGQRMLRGRPNHQQAWNLKPMTQILAMNLPLACSQIRRELGQYFPFTFNSFGATTSPGISLMLEPLTTGQRDKIEVITTNYTHASRKTWQYDYVTLSTLPSLKLLVLRDLGTMDDEEKDRTFEDFQNGIKNRTVKIEILDIC